MKKLLKAVIKGFRAGVVIKSPDVINIVDSKCKMFLTGKQYV